MTLHILALETSSSLCGVALLSVDNGLPLLRCQEHDATAQHAERLLPMVDQLLAQAGIGSADLSVVAFGQGPGGFTGLRVACGVAQGIAFALDIPVIPVGSLLAIAAHDAGATDAFQSGLPFNSQGQTSSHQVPDPLLRIVVQDARMGELYVAAYWYDNSVPANPWHELQSPLILNASDIGHWLKRQLPAWQKAYFSTTCLPPLRLLGDALQVYPELAAMALSVSPGMQIGPASRPDVQTMAKLAWVAWQRQDTLPPEQAAPLYVRDKVAFTTLEREQGQGGNPKAPAVVHAILPMASAHLDQVCAIEQSVQSFPWTRRNFEDGLKADYGAWVSTQAGKVTGFCMAMFAPDIAHVLVLGVAPIHQKKGLGALLIRQCEREARARGLPGIMLEVRQSNNNAQNFYQHLGFVVFANRKDYYPAAHGSREDALVMEKRFEQVRDVHG